MSEPTHAGGPAPLRSDDPLARKVTQVIRSGTAAELRQVLHEHPALVRARLGDGRGHARSLLHVVTDWPGHVPEAGAKIRALAAAGADAFTIGTAAFDGSFAPRMGSLRSQLRAVLDACR